MNPIRHFFARRRGHFTADGRRPALTPFYDALERVFFGSPHLTQTAPHPRDSLSVQRFMMLVIVAVLPCLFFGIFNVGLQAFKTAGLRPDPWAMAWLGIKTVMPLVIISYLFGFGWEIVFAAVRKHPISEGVFVTAMLFPLTLPPTTPWWQAALGISFGVVVGKEIFGGTGRNFLNPALTGRAFLFFAYPAQMSGDKVWSAVAGGAPALDGLSAATPLTVAAAAQGQTVTDALHHAGFDPLTLLLGLYPDSIGASSTVLCALGAAVLILVGVASYRIVIGAILGLLAMGYLCNLLGSLLTAPTPSPYLALDPWHHLAIGGAAFGFAFMATDPVTAPHTPAAHWVYGLLIGALTVLIRVFNPAFPEGVMLAILFMNAFAPLLDHVALHLRLRRRIPNI